ncbi:unnamed protein product [Phytophthora lilii]|uniref:Unnamed protein product n=1 Tax=Phytophthora lilii TaxID=2077276 RepID=A0A9W6WP52_9STRA|nr:unnamed protein product [Phytophthora lilii]
MSDRGASGCTPASIFKKLNAMPKFHLVFGGVKIKNELLVLIAQALTSNPSGSFQRVDQEVQELLAVIEVATPRWRPRVEICLDLFGSSLRLMDSANEMRTLLQAASKRNAIVPSSSRVLFRVRRLDLRDTTISERDLAPLAETLALPGLSVSKLDLGHVFNLKTSNRFMRSFCRVIALCFGLENVTENAATAISNLCLDYCTLSAFQVASLFSAIFEGSTRGVRELSLRGFEGNDQWLWLALGVFHPSSKSQLAVLDLSNCVLRFENIELMRNILESTDYTAYLKRKQSTQTDVQQPHHQWALLPVGTRLEIPREAKQHTKGRSGPALKLRSELWCKVVELGVAWVCIMVPAYGLLYVKKSKIVRMKTRFDPSDDVSTPQQACKLKTLIMNGIRTISQVLSVSEDGKLLGPVGAQPIDHVVAEWIGTIGNSLQKLHIRNNPLSSHTLAVVLQSCPLLAYLDVNGCELTDITPITIAFRRESSVLRALIADQNHFTAASQEDFFRVLGDAACAGARNLEILNLEDNPTSPENSILFTLFSSLLNNSTLRHLTLMMNEKHFRAEALRHTFNRYHHNKRLGYAKLPLQHRIALLSVPMASMLPIAVLEIVFDFARRSIYRQVQWR